MTGPRIVPLSRPYPSRDGAPVLDRVDLAVFTERYFARCMACTFCGDDCCSYGVDVEAHGRLLAHADGLEAFVGIPRARWFTGEWREDPEVPGGLNTRTAVVDGRCVFLNRAGRGCLLHAFALERGLDYHDVKPMISSLFPVTFDAGLLRPSFEVQERSLVCGGEGPTLYAAARGELAHYFGEGLVAELDALAPRPLPLATAG